MALYNLCCDPVAILDLKNSNFQALISFNIGLRHSAKFYYNSFSSCGEMALLILKNK